ncbi:MAG: hypothetical protein ACE5HR_00045 [bacterium]
MTVSRRCAYDGGEEIIVSLDKRIKYHTLECARRARYLKKCQRQHRNKKKAVCKNCGEEILTEGRVGRPVLVCNNCAKAEVSSRRAMASAKIKVKANRVQELNMGKGRSYVGFTNRCVEWRDWLRDRKL